MPDPLHSSLQLCEAGIVMSVLEMGELRLKTMGKDHTFSKWHNHGSHVVSFTLKFEFPLFLPPLVVPDHENSSSSKNVPT